MLVSGSASVSIVALEPRRRAVRRHHLHQAVFAVLAARPGIVVALDLHDRIGDGRRQAALLGFGRGDGAEAGDALLAGLAGEFGAVGGSSTLTPGSARATARPEVSAKRGQDRAGAERDHWSLEKPEARPAGLRRCVSPTMSETPPIEACGPAGWPVPVAA